jgi:hypothetical protein
LGAYRNTTVIILNRLVYYPTGSYGTFVQWLCNTADISGLEDLPFHADGNSHKYVLTDQYRLLISEKDEKEFVSADNHNVISCIWPVEHNGRMFNVDNQLDFYFKLSQQHLAVFDQPNVQTLVIYPTETSKIWWWHNNCKKVFYTPDMFDKKIKNQYADLPWLTTTDPVQRAGVQMNYYQDRPWFKTLAQNFQCADAGQLTRGQLRTVMAHSIVNETFDYLSHWQQLPEHFPNIKFVSLDQLRDHTKDTIQGILEYFNVESNLPLDFVLDHWTPLQTTRNRDAEHSKIVNCIVNGQPCDWSDLNFDLFDEVYLYYTLKFKHNIALNAEHVDCLPTNTHDLLLLR